jgi:hypothetical protein
VHDDGAAQAGEEIVRYRHHPIPHPRMEKIAVRPG